MYKLLAKSPFVEGSKSSLSLHLSRGEFARNVQNTGTISVYAFCEIQMIEDFEDLWIWVTFMLWIIKEIEQEFGEIQMIDDFEDFSE